MSLMKSAVLILILSFLVVIPAHAQDDLGIPCANKPWIARNVWDMIVFQDRLYVGCGDYHSNAGPIDVWSRQGDADWVNEYTVDEEQIGKFRVLDGTLVIPGMDARQGHEFGNWYDLEVAGWTKHRNIPGGLHVFDIFDYQGMRFAALGADPEKPALAISKDGGQTWTEQLVPGDGQPQSVIQSGVCTTQEVASITLQAYNFFTIDGDLYLDTNGYGQYKCTDKGAIFIAVRELTKWDGTQLQPLDIYPFPGLVTNYMYSPTTYGKGVVYIGHSVRENMGYVYEMGSDLVPQTLTVPNCTFPQSLTTSSGVLYALCGEPAGDNWRISVQTTCDLIHWTELVNFTEPTYARSFALGSDAIYFGLGADNKAPKKIQSVVGTVYREAVTPPAACPAS